MQYVREADAHAKERKVEHDKTEKIKVEAVKVAKKANKKPAKPK